MIVDTSVLIAILRDEPDAARFRQVLAGAQQIRMSAGTWIEAQIVADREQGLADLRALVTGLNIEIVHTTDRQLELAFEGFQRFGKGRHSAGLNCGDLFAYALARATNEPLLFKGSDFALTDVQTA